MKISSRWLETGKRIKNNFYIYELKSSAGEPVINLHWHEEFEIFYTDCDGVVVLDAEAVPFAKNSFVFINKEQLHSATAHSGGKLVAFVFDLEFLDFGNDDFCQTEIIDKLKNKIYLFPRFAELEESLRGEILLLLQKTTALYYSDVPGRELKIKCNLYEMIFLLYSNGKLIPHPKGHPYDCVQLSYVKDTIAYMENNYFNPITIDELAKNININKSHFIKIFKRITGETPIIYLRNLRIDISRDLLSKGYSITQAAFLSGFNNVSYYIRHFKARNHVTPKEYQRDKGYK